MSKKKIYWIAGIIIGLIALLVILKKNGTLGSDEGVKEIETAKVDEITIVETVSERLSLCL